MAGGSAEEAAALMKSAEKHSQKKLFRRPDWDTAANEYEKAARIYTFLEDTTRASDAWRKASETHQKAENKYFAALAMENLAIFLAEQARKGIAGRASLLNTAVEVYCEASKLYALNDMFDRQADTLKKAAEVIDPTTALAAAPSEEVDGAKLQQERQQRVQQVAGFFREGVDVLEEHIEDKPVLATQLPELYRSWMLTHLHNGDVKGAVEVLEQELGIRTDPRKKGIFERLGQPHRSAKVGLEIIVLCLSCGDEVWAAQEMNKLRSVAGFLTSKEEATANALLASFEDRDEEQLQAAVKDQTLQFITIDISRTARKLKLRFSAPQRTEVAAAAAASSPQQSLGELQPEPQQLEAEIDPEEDIR
ncbi:putative Gamma-soluble NSF attachment protein (SNAP-gamma) (N-ethylmaleimide-sensitive factor attachment protein, gamma) [Trypanosoma conorhini]|uniref:Gamma-soluble NSF attachment protein n=1 Tax=Trypanosoma conorhini TaxID=83891 RepID=A0A422P7Q2_9TRYP|nr:putative Gamma-soluble NSF attachment protein (SNAP-gamma) (N-ethylmaleimide-sensitive factor attachment protein, gamma) [Trypanosoma conorhini]RNF13745.1 putative Gamma-soluble NSF attachment protein (SNAP-gamma) (N-ethylmaleimide-sensitive factor attachment protein, gamma) [Trypanosoma conorhini]